MPVVLYRVDERLIHGQVVVGWATHLNPDLIAVVDDDVAASDWEQELYVIGVPPQIETTFTDVAAARARLPEWRTGRDRILLLTRDLGTMNRLAEGGLLEGEEVNLGGIHHAPEREAVLPYLFLSGRERRELEALASAGVRVSARDLPGSRQVELDELLGGSRERAR